MITHVNKKEIKYLYNQLKTSASKRGIAFDLTLTELGEISFPITCPVLNIPLAFNRGNPQDNSYSIDRIDSTKGYSVDNIIVVSNRANKIKSDATLKELQQLVEYYSDLI